MIYIYCVLEVQYIEMNGTHKHKENEKNDIVYNHVGTAVPGLILGLRPANERRRYKVTPSLIGWAQT